MTNSAHSTNPETAPAAESITVYLAQQKAFGLTSAGGLFLQNDVDMLRAARLGMLRGVALIDQFLNEEGSF